MNIKEEIESFLKEKISQISLLSGGCIASTNLVKTISNRTFFLKSYKTSDMHHIEARGLKELAKPDIIKTPNIIKVTDSFLLLEFIKEGCKDDNFFELFAAQFAQLHSYTNDKFGFDDNNFIGSTEQINNSHRENWSEFYWTNRLLYQFKLAEKKGYITAELSAQFAKLENIIEKIIQTEEKPSLLHGDLWSGNFMINENTQPVLIDPAIYYGNREADLAMTKLFGGFSEDFYDTYNEIFPLEEDFQYRENIYKLYHLFNHLNLFGTSYYNQVLNNINFYI